MNSTELSELSENPRILGQDSGIQQPLVDLTARDSTWAFRAMSETSRLSNAALSTVVLFDSGAPSGRPADVAAPADGPPPLPGDGLTSQAVSESPRIREKLAAAGIDVNRPGTVRVAVFEPADTAHARGVAGIITDERLGIYPGAATEHIDYPERALSLRDYVDRPNGLNNYISDMGVGAIRGTTDEMKSRFSNEEFKVVNLSYGSSRSFLCRDVLNEFIADPEKNRKFIEELIGPEKTAEWIDYVRKQTEEIAKRDPSAKADDLAIRGHRAPHAGELLQKIIGKVDETLDRDPRFTRAMEEYRQVTRAIADRGTIIVVAAGNDHAAFSKYNVTQRDDAYLAFEASSEHVIAVANVDILGTPHDRRDDRIALSSSPGYGRYLPVVGAHGEYVASPHGVGGVVGGTSFAAPLVAGTVALMLEQNPKLKLPEIRQILQSTATRLDAPVERQGAGVLNADRAVIEARSRARGGR